jgi:hypothetical protein
MVTLRPNAATAIAKSIIKGAVYPPVPINKLLAPVAMKEAKIKLKLVILQHHMSHIQSIELLQILVE